MLTPLLMSARVRMVHSPTIILREGLAYALTFVARLRCLIRQPEG